MKKIFFLLGIILTVLVVIVFFNTVTLSSKQMIVAPVEKITLKENEIISHLSEAVQYRTISTQEPDSSKEATLLAFRTFLKIRFPLVHQNLKVDHININTLIYHWNGKNPALKPILLMSHQDVVPVDDTSKWDHPPFEGFTDNEFIHGRGTLDDKCGVLGILEAAEYLIGKGFQPERSIYFLFGHDEEIGGESGAKLSADWFRSKKIEFQSVLDEGGTIVKNIIPGVKPPVALIGIAEKGYATVELNVVSEGGHSSMPPPHTAAGILAAALVKLEMNQFNPSVKGATKMMFEYLAPEMDFGSRLAFANLWLLEKVVLGKMTKKNSTNAAVRTTTAVTMISSGTKENVLPVNAGAKINFRILPGETSADVLGHVRKTIAGDTITAVLAGHLNEPSAVSDPSSEEYKMVNKSVLEIFPGILVAPYLVLGSTDSKHFSGLSQNIFRFLPIILDADDLKRIHGSNERISKQNYLDIVKFYVRYLENTAKAF